MWLRCWPRRRLRLWSHEDSHESAHRKCARKCARSIFTCPTFTCFVSCPSEGHSVRGGLGGRGWSLFINFSYRVRTGVGAGNGAAKRTLKPLLYSPFDKLPISMSLMFVDFPGPVRPDDYKAALFSKCMFSQKMSFVKSANTS